MNHKLLYGIAFLVGITAFSTLTLGVPQQISHSQQMTWSQTRTAMISQVWHRDSSTLYMTESNLFIETTPSCSYKVGDIVFYQVSTVDYSIGTERIQLSGCSVISPTQL
jgi:hypothetical protein